MNFPEYSSPSSSIVFPFLLSLLMATGISDQGPLLIGLSSCLVAIWFACPILLRRGLALDGLNSLPSLLLTPLAVLLLANAFALPMMGMEHPLHILAVTLVASGLIALSEGEAARKRLILGVLLGAATRFEGIALGLAVVGILFSAGRPRLAWSILALLALGLGSYGLCMARLGLPLLPSSILAKSSVSTEAMGHDPAGIIGSLLNNTSVSLENRWGILSAVLALFLLPFAAEKSPRSYLAKATVAALAAHVVAGGFGAWGPFPFGRYEVYGVVLLVLAGFTYFAPDWRPCPLAPASRC
ncbi:putative membrane protein of unknown function [Rubellimicrobium mesophilum DSM 19309]|uniref:Uncharacterized protein n=1 Tax=Rubellimicrobium mesophilum DSM 19309 TaxID=442562 RepID=A0A017HK88_9RHOB|nr:hypothetical protein [Rubellimicrobium mesophilum]EYD74781.1 putative membrane protein of unknown function [Rubellimicrobium mesophilum DSM 19309]